MLQKAAKNFSAAFLILFFNPATGSSDCAFPLVIIFFCVCGGSFGIEDPFAFVCGRNFFKAFPNSGIKSRKSCCAKSGCFNNFRAFDGNSEKVGLDLHHKVAYGSAAVNMKNGQVVDLGMTQSLFLWTLACDNNGILYSIATSGQLVEIQGTGEGRAFTIAEQQELVKLCAKGIKELNEIQKEVLGGKVR